MITIFTIPKPFVGHNAVIQKNAIKSWLQLRPKCEIILLGDDAGVSEIANELNVLHIPYVEKNKFGTPLLSSAFSSAQKIANNNILMYANSDIIFYQDLIDTVRRINMPFFLMCGRRWDLDILYEIDFSNKNWSDELLQKVKKEGKMHGFSGVDYFIFSRGLIEMLPFAVGRPGWDGWLIYNYRIRGLSVIDTSSVITVVHQNHDYSHSKFGQQRNVIGPERDMNTKLAGGASCMMTLREANLIMDEHGIKPPKYPRRVFAILSLIAPWRYILSIRRNILVIIDSLKGRGKAK